MTLLRKRWLQIHTYLGLSVGLIWVLLGLTGSILVFYLQIDLWLNPETSVQLAPPVVEQQAVFEQLFTQFPTRTDSWRVEMPLYPDRPLMARYYTPVEKIGQGFAPLIVTLDPATLLVTSERFWSDFVVTWIYDLHYKLLLGDVGHVLVGLFGLVSLISLISGIVLWWPGWRKVGTALKWRIRTSSAKKIFDIHILSGSYGLILLFMLSVTGAALSFPTETKVILSPLSGFAEAPVLSQETTVARTRLLTADVAVHLAKQYFPEAELRWIESPGGRQKNSWRVNLYQQGEPSRRFPRTQVWINANTGEVEAVRDGLADTTGDKVRNWLHPLHNGEVFGLVGRWLVFIAGLLPVILFVTGVLRWQQKQRAKDKKKQRNPA